MKKILLLTTGGTISCKKTNDGLKPTNNIEDILNVINLDETLISYEEIMLLDSSNIQPEEWKIIAKKIFENMKKYDGIIITHGTDTLAYTATMMCFMIQNPNIPIVFTGSQLPLTNPLTDAISNLRIAFEMAKTNYGGIFIAFGGKIILGCRAVKVRTIGFDAFESINLKSVGKINSNGLNIRDELLQKYELPPTLNTNIDTNVFLLKLTPTTNPDIIDLLVKNGIKGIVIEAYGAGGISFIRRDFISKIKNAIDQGVLIVVTSQCLYESSNFHVYEVGNKALEVGVIEALDMTTEAAVCKLMYSLANSKNQLEAKEIFKKSIAREIAQKEYK